MDLPSYLLSLLSVVAGLARVSRLPVELLNGYEDEKRRKAEPQAGEHSPDVGTAVDVGGVAPCLEP